MYSVLPAFPAIPCFLCCRCCSAVTRAGWPGWSTSALVPCALQQPLWRCSAQRPSSSTLSGTSSSPAIWRKEHDLLLCRAVLVHDCSKGLCFFQKICMEKRFPRVFGSTDKGAAMLSIAAWILFCLLNWSVQQKRGEWFSLYAPFFSKLFFKQPLKIWAAPPDITWWTDCV